MLLVFRYCILLPLIYFSYTLTEELSKNAKATSIIIQGQSLHFNVSTACSKPFFMVRSFGEYANFVRKHKNEWISNYPLSGQVILDITLITCNAFSLVKKNCVLSKPLSLYRHNHTFAETVYNSTNNLLLVKKGSISKYDTRYQDYSKCPKMHYTANCTQSVTDAYEFTIRRTLLQHQSWCFIGSSHAKRMHDAAIRRGINSTHLTIRYAHEISNIYKNASLCEQAIIHIGQWDLGWPGKKFTPLESFTESLNFGFATFKNASISTIVLSNNYNPLGKKIISCPPADWRRPDYIDTYNLVIRETAHSYGHQYIDNNAAVVGVLWDSGKDWNHYEPRVNDAIIDNIMGIINHGTQSTP